MSKSMNTREACNRGAKLELKDPVTREGIGNYIHIVGKDGDTFRGFIARSANAERRKEFEAKRKNKPVEPKTFEESEAEGIALAVACTTGFECDPITRKEYETVPAVGTPGEPGYVAEQRVEKIVTVEEGGNFLRIDGKKIPFNEEAATKFYFDYPDFFRQANDGMTDLELFMPG